MAIVDWETFFFGVNRETWIAIEVNDANNAIRRVRWQVEAGARATIEIPELSFVRVVDNLQGTVAVTGDENVPGNHQLVLNTDDPDDPYLEAPWTWRGYLEKQLG